MGSKRSEKIPLPQGSSLWAEPPDRTERMKFVLVWAKPGQQISAVLLSNECRWVDVHFQAGESHLCIHAGCQRCQAGQTETRKQGYLSIWQPGRSKPVVLMVPAGLRGPLWDLSCAKQGLRGLKVLVTRSGEERNSACTLKLVDDWRAKKLPPGANLDYCVPLLFGYLPAQGASEWDAAPAADDEQQRKKIRQAIEGVGKPADGKGGVA